MLLKVGLKGGGIGSKLAWVGVKKNDSIPSTFPFWYASENGFNSYSFQSTG